MGSHTECCWWRGCLGGKAAAFPTPFCALSHCKYTVPRFSCKWGCPTVTHHVLTGELLHTSLFSSTQIVVQVRSPASWVSKPHLYAKTEVENRVEKSNRMISTVCYLLQSAACQSASFTSCHPVPSALCRWWYGEQQNHLRDLLGKVLLLLLCWGRGKEPLGASTHSHFPLFQFSEMG